MSGHTAHVFHGLPLLLLHTHHHTKENEREVVMSMRMNE